MPFIEFLQTNNVNSFIEIGTYRGGTMYVLSSICGGKKISVDFVNAANGYKENDKEVDLGDINVVKRNQSLSDIFTDIHFVCGDSHRFETHKKVADILKGDKVDLIFIDGDHSYYGVKRDSEMYSEFVRFGGFIAFHDIKRCEKHNELNCHVDEFWNELQGEKTEFCISDTKDMGIGVIKI